MIVIGSDKGKTVRKLVEDENNTIITPECVLAELKGWALRQYIDFEELYKIVRKLEFVEKSLIFQFTGNNQFTQPNHIAFNIYCY